VKFQCGNSEIKEIQRGTQEIKRKSSESSGNQHLYKKKLLLLCLLFVLTVLFVLFEKNSCGNQQINVELKMELKEDLKEEISKIKEELKEELKKSRGISKWNLTIQSGISKWKSKTSNKLKTKNKNLGCLVEKMSQVLR
jgi:sensor domain CHASE-containing protein